MPFAAKRPCRSDGCRNVVSRGYCDACRAKGRGATVRLNSTQRGYGAKWQKASKAYLAAHPVAEDWFGMHGERVFAAEVVDHIIPHRGDMKLFWDPSNWQGLTKRDHDRKTAQEDGGFGRAPRTGYGGKISSDLAS
ncbi:MAG: HNH endonuclease signature motif containing protein [Acidobacteriaceae bacterium]